MPGVPWIKLWVGIFDDEKIKIIQQFPEGDTIILCWLKLLCMAGKCGMGGKVAVNENIPYADDMLAAVWGTPVATVRLAVETLEKLGMLKLLDGGDILITNWDRYQSVKSYDDVKEQWRIRQQKHRQKQLPDMSRDKSRDVTLQELEVEERIRSKKEDILSRKSRDSIPFKQIIDYLNSKTGRDFKHTTKETQRMIKARWNGDGFRFEDFQKAIAWCVWKWGDDEKMIDFLRPSTIFRPKMEAYIQNYERGESE